MPTALDLFVYSMLDAQLIQALSALHAFRADVRGHLPQFGAPTMDGFWGIGEGIIECNARPPVVIR